MMRVKICGITNLEDALLATELGAWALGFNFYSQSPRYISPSSAAEIIKQLPDSVIPVGIFVNSTMHSILQHQLETRIQIIQLHGDESIDDCKKIPFPIVKGLHTGITHDLRIIKSYANHAVLLLDSFTEDLTGGTGKCADWSIASQLAMKYPIILAGGLHSANIQLAISTVKPAAVDVCSGVESFPGKKSRTKMIAFFDALR